MAIMTFDEYRDIIRNGEKTDWYGEQVPMDLINNNVMTITNMIIDGLAQVEMDINELKKGSKERSSKQDYYDKVMDNVRKLPYSQNGMINDCYLFKYKKIISEIEKEELEKNKKTTSKKRVTKPKAIKEEKPKLEDKEEIKEEPKVRSRRGKSNSLIFGKNK
jgi:hypothetical protein